MWPRFRSAAALLFWLLLGGSRLAMAQTSPRTFAGTVTEKGGEALGGISLTVETRDNTVLAYGFTDEAGAFRIGLETGPDSVRLRARSMSHAEWSVLVPNRSQQFAVVLTPGEIKLKEVTVKGAPITRQGDTLSYKVDAFANKQDRVIADVLKKMPGIEVGGDGQISYEGKPINKFYINGQDLLESRYTMASNNLPADAVQSVQVLERHQPIRALDSLARPENAALNLELKKKVTATGQARLGAGWGAAPLGPLWSANVSPMLFAGRQQLIDTYQGNNTGQDVAAELKPLTLADLQQGSELSTRKPDLTHIQGLGSPPVAANRYLFNQVHLLSANHLVTISPENQLRVNASYLHDVQTQRGGAQTRFFLPDNRTVTLTEAKSNRLTFSNLLADFAFIKNVKRYYLKNTLSLDGRWDAQTGDLARAETGLRITQQARNPFVAVSNRLGLVRPLSGGRIVQLSSFTFFSNSPQQLAVQPGAFAGLLTGGVPYDSARQQARLGAFFTNNSAGLTLSRGGWAYSGQAGFSQEIQRLTSTLTTSAEPDLAGPPLRNDLRWNRGRYYLEPGLSRKADTWQASLSVPVSYYDFRAEDAPLGAGQRLRAVVAEPSLSLRRDLGPLWYVSASAGLSNDFGEISQLNYAYILRDYRTLQRNDAPLPRTQTQRYSGGFYFKNPLKSRFFNAFYSFSNSLNNRLYSSQVDASGAVTTVALDQNSRALTHSLNTSASQFISPWKTNLSLQASASQRQQPQVLNGQLAQTRTQNATVGLKMSVSAFDWGSLDYNATLTALRSAVADGPATAAARVQEHHASASIFPTGGHQFTLSGDYYDSRGPAPTVRAVFADLLYRYAMPTKGRKIDLELRWSNIFDTRQYQYSFVSPFQLAQTTYQLRPMQVLASARVSL
ncbi:carboxypeptidase-like regulatory domain-containing protein [Hymenobacter sp. DH14]|uniref:Carboxypeptidase-like regulatory domain-containing protein n=1 Tax=Hymenobacter cyanobacteriorum TaxID=2926463 RepID=A0A9X2AHJ6_9BACT|nr:carboxypeptidase-like regulatory domain-containing protein [Hymenobacter cyanobacteriorum]MCI1188948.1 carboxypeptidase-like regulatory domain-containing protein [Hymenobacter cyanobacteriorum]